MKKKLEARMHHTAISVSDLEKSIRWYKNMLGFKLVQKFEKTELDAKIALMAFGKYYVELFCSKEHKPLPSYRNTHTSDLKTIGTKHMALGAENIEEACMILKAKGVKFESGPAVGGSGHRFAFFKDPDGVLIELFELKPCRR